MGVLVANDSAPTRSDRSRFKTGVFLEGHWCSIAWGGIAFRRIRRSRGTKLLPRLKLYKRDKLPLGMRMRSLQRRGAIAFLQSAVRGLLSNRNAGFNIQ